MSKVLPPQGTRLSRALATLAYLAVGYVILLVLIDIAAAWLHRL